MGCFESSPTPDASRFQVTGGLYLVHNTTALCVDICTNMMRDLPRCVTESHLGVERGCAEPHGFSPALLILAPESHVVTLARVVADRFLECEILFAPEKEQITHRRLLIGESQHRS